VKKLSTRNLALAEVDVERCQAAGFGLTAIAHLCRVNDEVGAEELIYLLSEVKMVV
jgi:translation elongation factor EF-1beta